MSETENTYAELSKTIQAYTESELKVPVSRVVIEENREFGPDEILVTVKMRKIDKALSGQFFLDLVHSITKKIIETGEPSFPVVDPVVAKGQRIAGF